MAKDSIKLGMQLKLLCVSFFHSIHICSFLLRMKDRGFYLQKNKNQTFLVIEIQQKIK